MKLIVLILTVSILSIVILANLPARKNKITTTDNTSKDSRLADPSLLFASLSGSGMCRNKEGEVGGCHTYTFLYHSGKFISESAWQGLNNKSEVFPTIKKRLSQGEMDKIIQKIRESGVMEKNCPAQLIMDASFFYQINLDGTKKVFAESPPEDCRKILSGIDTSIDSATINTN